MTDARWEGSSHYERAVLSALETSVMRSSPRLAGRFEVLGRNRVPPRTWLALTLSWAGGVLVLITFATSPPVAFAGLGVMSGGVMLLIASESSRPRHRVPRGAPSLEDITRF